MKSSHPRASVVTIIIATILFAILAAGVATHAGFITAIDNFGIGIIRHTITPERTMLFKGITYLAQPITAVILAAAVLIFMVVTHRPWIGIFVVGNVIVGAAVMAIIKNIIQRPRPLEHLIVEHGFSFPSGHSTNAMVFYGSLIVLVWAFTNSKLAKWLLTIVLGLIVLGIPVSRVYLGAHYPTDVIAGLLLGLVIVTISANIVLPRHQRQ